MQKKRVEDEINFLELLKNPIRLFGLVYPYLFAVILLIGIFYVKNVDQISFNTVPVSKLDSLNAVRDIPQKKGGIMPAVDLGTIKDPTPEMINKGKELYDANCQSCHGAGGNGDGPAGLALNPKPRNFHNTDGWTNGREFTQLYKTLQEGIIKNGMAAYEYLPAGDRIAIINYIRTFTQFPEVTDAQVQDIDIAYNLSAGTVVPNQIPVKKSLVLISSEFSNSKENVKLNEFINATGETEGARILKAHSSDPEKIINAVFRGEIENNADDFIRSVSLAPIDYGYKAGVVQLSKDEWLSLFNYLQSIANLKKS